MGIPPEMYNRLHSILLRCEAFESDRVLRAVFADARIDFWRHRVPHADSPDERVKDVVDYLHRRTDEHGENALVLLLRVLGEQMPPTDARHQELAVLADDLEHEFKLHPPQPEAPETFAQKFAHFFIGDTEAQRAYRNRQAMLKLVHNTWIKGVLEQSLHGAVLIELGMKYDPTAVDHPWDMVVQMPEHPDKQLPPGTHIVDVFDDVGGSLLILGEPGSGKTTMLLELARDLIARAEGDDTLQIPVVFNLSSWVVKQQSLEEWLIEELRTKYYIPKKVAQAWVNDDALLLLLDGLDEVKSDTRDKCVSAINAFRKAHIVSLVICSRTADYEALTAKLNLQGAISLRPLTRAQINAYLKGAGVELQAVRATLQHDPDLQEMAKFPLMLSIMTLAYSGLDTADLQTLATPEARRQHLMDTYLESMFQRRANGTPYTPEQTHRWLSWLAAQLTIHKQPLFLIENLQPDWLPDRDSRRVHRQVRLVLGLSFLALVLVISLASALVSGMIVGPIAMIVGPTALLIAGLVGPGKVELVEKLTWSWQKAYRTFCHNLFSILRVGGILGLIAGLVLGLVDGLPGGLVTGLIIGLSSALGSGLIFGLNAGFDKEKVETKTVPAQGIHQSLRNALRVVLGTGLVLGLISGLIGELGLGLVGGLILGLTFELMYGGMAVILHYILLYTLTRTGHTPWNYTRFLDYCVERIFLRRVGGGYIFIHRLLQEHFASLTPEDIKRIAGDSRATV